MAICFRIETFIVGNEDEDLQKWAIGTHNRCMRQVCVPEREGNMSQAGQPTEQTIEAGWFGFREKYIPENKLDVGEA